MARLDDRLQEELERASQPADPSGLYEHLIRRRERRRIRRRVQRGAIALVVVLGSIAGFTGLSRIFRADEDRPAAATPANGVLGLTVFDRASESGVRSTAHIFTLRPDGTGLTQLTSGNAIDTDVSWSPDGRQIAFWRSGTDSGGIWVAAADGSDPRQVLETQLSIGAIEWSPDGSRIAFVGTEVIGISGSQLDFPTHVYVMTSEGADLTQVTHQDQVTDFAWSPDGDRFVLERQFDAGNGHTGNDLSLVGLDGSGETALTTDGVSRDPGWSPDGSKIVFVRSGSGGFQDTDLFTIAPDGSGLRRLTNNGTAVEDPTWSPDGTHLAFTRFPHGDGTSCDLVVMSADGSSAATIADKSTLGGCPLDLAWQAVPQGVGVEPEPSESPTATPSQGNDIGLGFPVCNVSSLEGSFFGDGQHQTAYVATRASDTGHCPEPGSGSDVVAVDLTGDRRADLSLGPIGCELVCRVFSAPDVDGDGTSEILVAQAGGSVLGLGLYDVRGSGDPGADGATLVRIGVAEPGDPAGGFRAGRPVLLWLGGDEFMLYTLRCGTVPTPEGPAIVATAAESLPHDVVDAVWHAHEVTLSLGIDGDLHVLSARDFTEPVSSGPGGPSFGSGETLCGSNLGP